MKAEDYKGEKRVFQVEGTNVNVLIMEYSRNRASVWLGMSGWKGD